ncbi:MAG TPA: hypothetical protein VGF12_18845 [Roseateles sp.]|uniref:hypothetical protein n=1 Tax=Roseateles sp. TaxID=1971397 RepID=UPI002ED81FD8
MNARRVLEDVYWQEFSAALRSMVGAGAVLAAACAASLTLSGAAMRTAPPVAPALPDSLPAMCRPLAGHLPTT